MRTAESGSDMLDDTKPSNTPLVRPAGDALKDYNLSQSLSPIPLGVFKCVMSPEDAEEEVGGHGVETRRAGERIQKLRKGVKYSWGDSAAVARFVCIIP